MRDMEIFVWPDCSWCKGEEDDKDIDMWRGDKFSALLIPENYFDRVDDYIKRIEYIEPDFFRLLRQREKSLIKVTEIGKL